MLALEFYKEMVTEGGITNVREALAAVNLLYNLK